MDINFLMILQKHLPYAAPGRVDDGTRLRDAGLNSMQAIELLFELEDAFGVMLPDEKLTDATFDTAGSLWQAIDDLREHEAADVP
jgi:acyl carrier protein